MSAVNTGIPAAFASLFKTRWDWNYTTTEQKCATVYDTSEKRLGYEVRYRLNGQEATVKMDHDPGERIPVRDGQLVLEKAAAAATSG